MGTLETETELLLVVQEPEEDYSCDNPSELQHELFGYALIVGSGLFFEVMSLIVRYLSAYAQVPAKNIVFLRGLTQVIFALFCTFFLLNSDDALTVPFSSVPLLLLRGAFGGASLTFDFSMLQRVQLGPATSIFFLNPVFTLMLSVLILRERVTWREVFACALCFLGIVLVANPTFSYPSEMSYSYLIGVLFGLFSAFLTASEIVCIRMLAGRIHFLINVLAMGIGILVAGIVTGGSDVPVIEKPKDIAIAVFACILGFLGQCMINAALKFCRASTGALFQNIDVPFGYCFGLFLGEVPKLLAIVGSTLVVIGTAIVGSNAAR